MAIVSRRALLVVTSIVQNLSLTLTDPLRHWSHQSIPHLPLHHMSLLHRSSTCLLRDIHFPRLLDPLFMSKHFSRMQSPRERYTNRTTRPANEPTTSPTTSSTTTSSSDSPAPGYHTSSPNSPASLLSPVPALYSGPHTSGLGGSHSYHPPPPHPEDQNQKLGQNHIQHRGHSSTSVLPGLEPPYISRNLQLQTNVQRGDYHPRSLQHPYHDQSRRSSKSSFQSHHSPTTLRPQQHHGDLLFERPNQQSPSVNSNGVISISVPPVPRYPVDDR